MSNEFIEDLIKKVDEINLKLESAIEHRDIQNLSEVKKLLEQCKNDLENLAHAIGSNI